MTAMNKPRALDLFCGAGGASVGLERAGFNVMGVDSEPCLNYPFHKRCCDLSSPDFSFDATCFDLVWASPPCQAFSAYRRRGRGVGDDAPDLIAQIRHLLQATGLPYVIENVPGAPLNDPVQLCGSSFGLDVRRHRWFEASFPIEPLPCDHSWQTPRFPPATNRKNPRCTVEVGVWRIPLETQQRAMGIDWMTREELSQAIPPAYAEYIGKQARQHIDN